MKHRGYVVCPECGAHLDPHNDKCDCEQRMAEQAQQQRQRKARRAVAANEEAVEHGWEEWLNG